MSTNPQIAFILRHDHPISIKYSETCALTCENIGLKYEFFEGYSNISKHEVWRQLDLFKIPNNISDQPAGSHGAKSACCTSSHQKIWKKIVDENIPSAIILEHDAVMLHSLNINIPEGLVALGYRVNSLDQYDYNRAGPPKNYVTISKHAGSHAYAITNKTANDYVSELKKYGPRGCIDMHYFQSGKRNISIVNPIAAVAYLRESTIQNKSSKQNIHIIDSFRNNLK